jgi:hypothetical protein
MRNDFNEGILLPPRKQKETRWKKPDVRMQREVQVVAKVRKVPPLRSRKRKKCQKEASLAVQTISKPGARATPERKEKYKTLSDLLTCAWLRCQIIARIDAGICKRECLQTSYVQRTVLFRNCAALSKTM